jgi:hypothetical protein
VGLEEDHKVGLENHKEGLYHRVGLEHKVEEEDHKVG